MKKEFTKILKALSDESRLNIVQKLFRDGEKCVEELQPHGKGTQSNISFHLNVLKNAGLVQDRKEGKYVYYCMNWKQVGKMVGWLQEIANPDKLTPSMRAQAKHILNDGNAKSKIRGAFPGAGMKPQNSSLKQKLIDEIRRIIKTEKIVLSDLVDMLEYSSPAELYAFRERVRHVHSQWKKEKKRRY